MAVKTRWLILGHSEMAGQAAEKAAEHRGDIEVIRPGSPFDYSHPDKVEALFQREKPDWVLVTGGKAGGIGANQRRPAELMDDNLKLASNALGSAARSGVKRLLYLGSACCYPKAAPSPLEPASLFTGPLEATNAAYGEAKLAGIALCAAFRKEQGRDFFAAIPANSYGPGDDFSPEEAHVVGALVSRFHAAKLKGQGLVDVWGSGRPRREFLYSQDLGEACLFLLENYRGTGPVNIGSGEDASIARIAELIKKGTGFTGEIRFDASKPDGMMERRLDSVEILALGWRPRTSLELGLTTTCRWYQEKSAKA